MAGTFWAELLEHLERGNATGLPVHDGTTLVLHLRDGASFRVEASLPDFEDLMCIAVDPASGNDRAADHPAAVAFRREEVSRIEYRPVVQHAQEPGEDFVLPQHGVLLEAVEKSLVTQALRRSMGNQSKAARLLGLNRDQIRYRIEKFGLRD